MAIQTGTIETRIPSRLDRLPWSGFHWRVVVGLGTVWILDGLEVTMVGSVAARLTEAGSGVNLTPGQIGIAAAIYVVGACLGALFFGQLTDRLGRKKLFMATLIVYLVATVATAFTFSAWYFYLARFVTGAGIGGEYAAINSAIDELIPARVRGRVDLIINGSYWLGSAAGAAAAIFFLSEAIFPTWLGWRLAFGVGAVFGLAILLVRRNVPESPRWLFIHGRQEEAERIVDGIERQVTEETGRELAEPGDTLTIRQRKSIPFRMIAETAFKLYPRRAVLGIALFTGQAFLYNGITFNLGTLFSTFFGVSSTIVPVFIVIYSLSNFTGPLLLGRLFDTVGRIPMIAGTYLGSALLTVPLAVLFMNGVLNRWTFLALIVGIFFLASAGASAAYLTVSEIFPMETRALAIAFFYAVGTAVGGITGPLLFGQLIGTEQATYVAIAFLIGAVVMSLGGIAELFLGVRAERTSLENIAKPLTAHEAEPDSEETTSGTRTAETGDGPTEDRAHSRAAAGKRAEAEQHRSQAAEHRAAMYDLMALGEDRRAQEEQERADLAGLRAQELDEHATAEDERATADSSTDEYARAQATACYHAAEQRANALAERAAAVGATGEEQARSHFELAEAAGENARAYEQRGLAEQCRAEAEGLDETAAAVPRARGDMHMAWARHYEKLGRMHAAQAEQDTENAQRYEREAREEEQRSLAAEERLRSAEHRSTAASLHSEARQTGRAETPEDATQAAEEQQEEREADQRLRERLARRRRREAQGLQRFRPGPGSIVPRARLGGLDVPSGTSGEDVPDREIDMLVRALEEHGPADRQELARLVGSRYWGPGRFGEVLALAVEDGYVQRISRRMYGPVEQRESDTPEPGTE